jgi:hypothetical protein
MADDKFMHLEKYQSEFEKHLGAVDQLGQVILKGHLIIESAVDNIINLILFHPEHIQDAQLSFKSKVQLARGLALRKNKISIWNLVLSVNAVRNEVAHNLLGETPSRKLDQLRRLYLAELPAELREKQKAAPDHVIAMSACMMCTGFLGTLEHDTKRLREYIDGLDAVLNPG